jgi:hypothetical protein
VPAELPQGQVVALEQFGNTRPVVKQPPDPGEVDQPDAQFDAARPVDAGQERVLLPPRLQLASYPLRVSVFTGEVPGGGEQGQVLEPVNLPHLLDVADLLF